VPRLAKGVENGELLVDFVAKELESLWSDGMAVLASASYLEYDVDGSGLGGTYFRTSRQCQRVLSRKY